MTEPRRSEARDEEGLIPALAYALARADLPSKGETAHDYATRLAPLVIESGHTLSAPQQEPVDDEPCGRCGTWRRFHGQGEVQGPEYSRDHSWIAPQQEDAPRLREAAQTFIDWYDSPGRSYRRDGSGPSAIAAIRAALASEDAPRLEAGLDADVLVFASVLCEDAHTLGYDHGANPTMIGFDTPYPSCPRHRAMANRLLLAVAHRLAAIEGDSRE